MRKAAVLIGLSIVVSGACDANAATTCTMGTKDAAVLIGLRVVKSEVCDANADTTSPMTDTFPFSTLADDSVSDTLSFAQFNPSLEALNNMDFSLNSSISGALPLVSELLGPFDFFNVAGLRGGLATTTDFAGSGKAGVDPDLTNLTSLSVASTVASTGKRTGQGPTLDPATTPLPAALSLFATGIAGLGLIGWRRKRKSRVSLLGVA
jgi:hypothetical protein